MRKIFFSLLAFILFLPCSFSQKPYLAEDLIAIVGNQPVLMSEWQTAINSVLDFRKQYGDFPGQSTPEIEAIQNLFAQKVLIECARRDSLDKNISDLTVLEQVTEMVDNLSDQVGGVKALEAMYGKPLFQIKEELKNSVIENELSNSMQNVIKDECKISVPEVREFYEQVGVDTLPTIPAQYCYAEIVKVPEATEEKQFEIRERLLDYRQRVLNGERLSVLARMYSQAHDGSPQKGGEVGPVDIDGLVPPFITALEQLEPGQVSEVVETEYGYHIIELISKKGNMVHFRHLLLIPEFSVEQVEQVTGALDSLVTAIRNGVITFDEAAEIYSNEKSSKFNGGVVFNTNYYQATGNLEQTSRYFLADELNPTEFNLLSSMNIGDVSDTYETINNKGLVVYKIIKLVDIRPVHKVSLDYEYPYLKEAALQKKCNEAIEKRVFEELDNIYFYIKPDYRNIPYSQPQWLERSDKCKAESFFADYKE